jgi:hypothetical protein
VDVTLGGRMRTLGTLHGVGLWLGKESYIYMWGHKGEVKWVVVMIWLIKVTLYGSRVVLANTVLGILDLKYFELS